MQLYKEGKYDASRKEAQNFVAKYPKSDLADNALFLVAEAYLAEKRYKEAIESYQQVQDRYPKGNKVASAMSQQAAAFQHLGDTTAARIIYERLIESYPGTPQAQIAEKELKKLQ
jgi:tol-pal system protein YbgF